MSKQWIKIRIGRLKWLGWKNSDGPNECETGERMQCYGSREYPFLTKFPSCAQLFWSGIIAPDIQCETFFFFFSSVFLCSFTRFKPLTKWNECKEKTPPVQCVIKKSKSWMKILLLISILPLSTSTMHRRLSEHKVEHFFRLPPSFLWLWLHLLCCRWLLCRREMNDIRN